MRITATHLIKWSDTREAQGMLPILIRRLITGTSKTTALSMAGGDSVNIPGWDGVLTVDQGNSWVPKGISYWEIGTSQKPESKAKSDFSKRISQISDTDAKKSTFVFVTSRRWPGKKAWLDKVNNLKKWANVYVWDADDLEAWLEISPATALWFGSQIGIFGKGIESIESHWKNWSEQSSPFITASALFKGREKSKIEIKESLSKKESIISVVADSQAESVAFVCALLIEGGHSHRAVCITAEDGWQFLDANLGIDLVLVADNRLSSYRAPRKGMSLIVPLTTGDKAYNLSGIGKSASINNQIEVRRPTPEEFKNALLEIGVEKSDAERYKRTLGRSWSIYRRIKAQNQSIKKPSWANNTKNTSLLILTLVGAWRSDSEGDKACISKIANKAYEEIENEFLNLIDMDDSPIIKIGSIWKAKSPLELLHHIGPKLQNTILNRFFEIARAIFEKPDPLLELEEDSRWMASIYGKVREESGIVLESMAESIAKIGYFSDINELIQVRDSVRDFVNKLLLNADEERWLSISPYLKSFAEAAPDEFINAIEQSLKSSSKPVARLITETKNSGFFGFCWHANLLWALELLAWYPVRFIKVANILSELSEVEITGNWGNTPFNSLVSLFRSWCPQTTASIDIRIRVLKNIVNKNPETGWNLLIALLPKEHDFSSPNAKPKWRDDDSGYENFISKMEVFTFIDSVASLALEKSVGNSYRISELIKFINNVNEHFQKGLIDLLWMSVKFDDENREVVRSSLREFLSWENSYNKNGGRHDRYAVDSLRPLYNALVPNDLVIRHSWLFYSSWVSLPDGRNEDYKILEEVLASMRSEAAREVYDKYGWAGIDRLAKRCKNPSLVGVEIASDKFSDTEVIPFLCNWYRSIENNSIGDHLTLGALNNIPLDFLCEFLLGCLCEFNKYENDSKRFVEFLTNAPQVIVLWKLVESIGREERDYFWGIVDVQYPRIDKEEINFLVRNLLEFKRPNSALLSIRYRENYVDCDLLSEILSGVALGSESINKDLDYHSISRIFEYLSESGYDKTELVGLEYTYYNILRNEEYGTPNLKSEIVNNPSSFVELVCLVSKWRSNQCAPLDEHLEGQASLANSFLTNERIIPGCNSAGDIEKSILSPWIDSVRELSRDEGVDDMADDIIGTWLSEWPINKNLQSWPHPVIAELLDIDDHVRIRAGFFNGVRYSRGVRVSSPYAGGDQERLISEKFRQYASLWVITKPNLAELIESLAMSFERDAIRHDKDGLFNQEL